MVAMLSRHNGNATLILLDGLEHILRAGAELAKNAGGHVKNPYVLQVERAGGVDKLEELTRSENKGIYEIAGRIIMEYLDGIMD